METTTERPEDLCLICGLCCNGVIFADVRLNQRATIDRLQSLGLKLLATRKKPEPSAECGTCPEHKLTQPCAAFEGRCRVYEDRPRYCREFECAVLKNLKAGRIDRSKAERVIATAQKRAEKVRRLLRQMGETTETLALSKRFQRLQRRMETEPITEETADLFGELSIAVHELNVLLSSAFYPGE